MEKQTINTLSSGLRLLHVPSSLPIAYVGVAINAGTRDELPDESGMAHFVEHLMFKGTTRRNATQIINRLENVGGQMDAYTTKEDTYVYATVPAEYTTRALELLADVVLHSTFPDNEIEKERIVVLDEIDSYRDTPSELIFDEFEEHIFPDSPLGRNILGSEQSLSTFDSARVRAFVNRLYTPENLLVFYMGPSPLSMIAKAAEKYFSIDLSRISRTSRISRISRTPIPSTKFSLINSDMDTAQTHCIIGCPTFPQCHPDRYKLVLLNNILGGPNMSSRLNMAIRERHGYCYNIESSLTGYTDTGLFMIYFGCDERNYKKTYNLTMRQLDLLREKPLTKHQLDIAKRQLRGQVLISNQNYESRILGISKQVLHNEPLRPQQEVLAEIDTYTAEDLQSLACSLFNEMSSLTYK